MGRRENCRVDFGSLDSELDFGMNLRNELLGKKVVDFGSLDSEFDCNVGCIFICYSFSDMLARMDPDSVKVRPAAVPVALIVTVADTASAGAVVVAPEMSKYSISNSSVFIPVINFSSLDIQFAPI